VHDYFELWKWDGALKRVRVTKAMAARRKAVFRLAHWASVRRRPIMAAHSASVRSSRRSAARTETVNFQPPVSISASV
jgi:hypothetical protein